MDHQILLCVLSGRFGISGTAFNWFQFYLSERTQSFVHAGLATDCFPITCSVPQGSVFGPLGFIAYIEDLTVVSEKHIVHSLTYIDDIQLYDSSTVADAESIRDHLTKCVSDVANWCASRRLQVNVDKTVTIWFARLHRIEQSLHVRPGNIQPNSVVRDLGVYRLRAHNETAHCQNFCCLFLSHSSSASGPSSGRPGSHTAAGHGVHHVQTRLL